MTDPAIVVAVVSLLGTAGSLVFGYLQASRKMSVDAATDYYDDLRADFGALRDRLDILDGYIVELESHVDDLHAMMIAAGLKPLARPKRPRRT